MADLDADYETAEGLSGRVRSLADSMETAIDEGRLRTVHALTADLRRLLRHLQAAHCVAARPLASKVDLLACGVTDGWSVDADDDEQVMPESHPTRVAFTRVRDLAIESCGTLLESTSDAGIDAIERATADVLYLAAVYLEAALGHYRSIGRFPDSYGGTLDELRAANTYEWIQSALSNPDE